MHLQMTTFTSPFLQRIKYNATRIAQGFQTMRTKPTAKNKVSIIVGLLIDVT